MTGPTQRKAAEMFFAHPARKDRPFLCFSRYGNWWVSVDAVGVPIGSAGVLHGRQSLLVHEPAMSIAARDCRLPNSYTLQVARSDQEPHNFNLLLEMWCCEAQCHAACFTIVGKCCRFTSGRRSASQQWSSSTFLTPQGHFAVCVRRCALACFLRTSP